MKLFPAFLLILFISCNSKKKLPKASSVPLVVSITVSDGSKFLDIATRVIELGVDSNGKVKVDTLWYLKRGLPVYKKDSTGKIDTSIEEKYFKLSKDSVNWRVENVPADSLQTPIKPKK